MIDIPTPAGHSGERYPFLDTLLRDGLPEIKLALGELIDRENARALPPKYARLLPETVLVVTLRPDAAEAIEPIASSVERELTDSCNRHGSLYDRSYKVSLHRSEEPDDPLFRVAAHAGHASPAPHEDLPAVRADRKGAIEPAPLPVADPDATRIDDLGPPSWQPGRWVLLVEDVEGERQEAFRLTDPFTTVGRRSEDPQLSTTVALSGVPHVSRRQLALRWQERDGAPGFEVYNLGQASVHLPALDLPGAHVGRGQLRTDEIAERHVGWLPPGVPLRIGDTGPVLRIEEVPEDEEPPVEDPEATQFE